ncbi:MAG: tetratricopeptide repeat protein, partial [Spirochaetota bacterium]|nr:tetratricopeptide repeat protein [Spirochaetota bacterium]
QKLAHCTYKLKLADKAINYIERSLEFDINIKAHNYKMATCYFLLGQLDQAIIQMKELLNITDNLHNEKPYNLLLDLFLKAFKLGIYDSHTFYIFELFTKKLGIIYKDFLEKEININDIKDTEILFDLAKHTLAQKKYLTSSIFLKKILKVNKNHLFALQLLGKIYYNYSKTKEKGIKIFFLLEKKNKTDGEIDFYLGLNYYENGDYKHSLKLFKQSKEKNYSNYKLFEKLGECYLQLNKKQFAIKYFARAINMESNNPELHLKLGKLYLEKKEYQKAIKYFKKTTKLDKDNKEAHLHLSTTYKLILNHESENHYSKYLNLN